MGEIRKPSIIQKEKVCYVCGCTQGLEAHEPFGKYDRKFSMEDGLWVWLCAEHHRGRNGVHGWNSKVAEELKETAQMAWHDATGKDINEWRNRYGKNYL